MSVYDEKGQVLSGQYPYSLLKMFRWSYDEKNHIGIDYFTQDEKKEVGNIFGMLIMIIFCTSIWMMMNPF